MGVDAYLLNEARAPKSGDKCFLSFEDDGYYWFLYGFFADLAKASGQMIDLYDDAFFAGENLELLTKTIQRARKKITAQPEVWQEFIGTILRKDGKSVDEKIFSTVYKKELAMILSKLEKAIAEAKTQNLGIYFFGD